MRATPRHSTPSTARLINSVACQEKVRAALDFRGCEPIRFTGLDLMSRFAIRGLHASQFDHVVCSSTLTGSLNLSQPRWCLVLLERLPSPLGHFFRASQAETSCRVEAAE